MYLFETRSLCYKDSAYLAERVMVLSRSRCALDEDSTGKESDLQHRPEDSTS
jgi:hypothetical protein